MTGQAQFIRRLEADLRARAEVLENRRIELEDELRQVNAELPTIYDALRPLIPRESES